MDSLLYYCQYVITFPTSFLHLFLVFLLAYRKSQRLVRSCTVVASEKCVAHTDKINIGSMWRSGRFIITFYTNAQNIESTGMYLKTEHSNVFGIYVLCLSLKIKLTSNIGLWLGLFSQFY